MRASGEPWLRLATPLFGVTSRRRNASAQVVLVLALGAIKSPASAESVLDAAAGAFHSCAVTEQGGVKCWGDNEFGQLGDGTTTDRIAPVDVVGLSEAVGVSAGYLFSCALTGDGGVWCWGNNSDGQLGDGSTIPRFVPGPVSGLASGVASISVGSAHACAVTEAGEALCWGWNAMGQLGIGSTTNSLVPASVTSLGAGSVRIAAAQTHTCAVGPGGAAFCWGEMYPHLGDGSTSASSVPVAVSGLASGVADIGVGARFGDHQRACARTQGGAVLCWGNSTGGAHSLDGLPTVVPGLESGVAQLSLGSEHSCVVMESRAVRCWGENTHGQLAGAPRSDPWEMEPPGAIYGLPGGALRISAGWFHTCVIVPGDGLRCWGDDFQGQVGDGPPPPPSATPLQVVGLDSGATRISANPYDPTLSSTCAVANGGAWCWGAFASNPVAGFPPHIPTQVPGFASGATDIFDVGGLVCVLGTNGAVSCSGPAELADIAWPPGSATAISAGDGVCVLRPDGGVQCQGAEMAWDEILGPYISVWTHTPVTSGMVAIDGSCALSASGGVSCWQRHQAPGVVPELASGIAKYEDGCGITTAGTLLCPESAIPPIPDLSGVTDVSVGSQHMCAVAGGNVHCWGDNTDLQLGVPAPAYSETPVQVPLGESAVEVAAGTAHTCAITSSGAVFCWGANVAGERGDGSVPRPVVPVPVLGLEGVAVPALGAPWLVLLAATLLGGLARRGLR